VQPVQSDDNFAPVQQCVSTHHKPGPTVSGPPRQVPVADGPLYCRGPGVLPAVQPALQQYIAGYLARQLSTLMYSQGFDLQTLHVPRDGRCHAKVMAALASHHATRSHLLGCAIDPQLQGSCRHVGMVCSVMWPGTCCICEDLQGFSPALALVVD
jgi:hypothetical protein